MHSLLFLGSELPWYEACLFRLPATLRRCLGHMIIDGSYQNIYREKNRACNENTNSSPRSVSPVVVLARSWRSQWSYQPTHTNPLYLYTTQDPRQTFSASRPSQNVAIVKDSKNYCQTRREVIQSTITSQTTHAVFHANFYFTFTGSQKVITTRHISNYEWSLPVTLSLRTGTRLSISFMAAHWRC